MADEEDADYASFYRDFLPDGEDMLAPQERDISPFFAEDEPDDFLAPDENNLDDDDTLLKDPDEGLLSGVSRMPAMKEVYGALGNHIALTTENHIKAIWRYWVAYCAEEERDSIRPQTGLSLYRSNRDIPIPDEPTARMSSLLEAGSDLRIDYHVVNGFLEYQSARPEMTKPNFEKTGLFLRAHLQSEYHSLKHLSSKNPVQIQIECPKQKVTARGSASRYPSLMKVVQKRKADQEKAQGVDIQADKERLISDTQRMALIQEAFAPTRRETQRISPIARMNFVAMFAKAFQIAKRGEAVRSHTLGMCYTEKYRLGPDDDLLTAFVLSNRGKENSVGRRTCTGFAPHYQPEFDALGWDGGVFLYRFGGFGGSCCLNEVLPNFLDPKELLSHHLYRSVRGGCKVEISGDSDQDTWGDMFFRCGIVCDKKTHQPRKQVQQELDFKLCPESHISRYAGYSEGGGGGGGRQGNKCQQQSYLTNQCVGIISSAAGSPHAHRHPETHSPPHFNTSFEDLVPVLFTAGGIESVLDERAKVSSAYGACSSRRELAARGLFMADGAINYTYEAVKRFILVGASRPMDVKTGRLNRESPRTYEKYENRLVYANPVFKCEAFKELVDRVTLAQEAGDDNIIELTPKQDNALTVSLKEVVEAPMVQLISQIQTMSVKIDRQDNERRVLHDERRVLQQRNQGLHSHVVNLEHDLRYLQEFVSSNGLTVPITPPLFTNSAVSPSTSSGTDVDTSTEDMDMDVDDSPESALVGWELLERAEATDDTTKTGQQRQRKRPRTQLDQGIFEVDNNMTPTMMFSTTTNRTLQAYWNEYAHGSVGRKSFRELEKSGPTWRKDITGKAKATAWCSRKIIYNLVEFYMDSLFCVRTMPADTWENRYLTEEEAVSEADKTFQCCLDEKGTPNFSRRLVPEFRRQQVYESSYRGRLVDPWDEKRFIPDVLNKLVDSYMKGMFKVGSELRSLTLAEAWTEVELTTTCCLPKNGKAGASLISEVAAQQLHENQNLGRTIVKNQRFTPTHG
jgi:hypothetical protein